MSPIRTRAVVWRGLFIHWYRSIFVNALSLSDDKRFLRSAICIQPAVLAGQMAVWWWVLSISVSPPRWMRYPQCSWYGSSAWCFGRIPQCPTLLYTSPRWSRRKGSCCWSAVPPWNRAHAFLPMIWLILLVIIVLLERKVLSLPWRKALFSREH